MAADTPLGDELSPTLEQIIRQRISADGGITFRDFMELSLYHEEHGYYMTDRTRIGREGDFFTSSSVHSLFGRLVGRQLQQMWEILGRTAPFTIAEQGAGEGYLCKDILDAIAEESPDFYRVLRYRLVEISPTNRQRQSQLLVEHHERVEWCETEDLKGMEGCFLSNELVDAFPVHLVEYRDGVLHEVFVVEQGGALVEELRPVQTAVFYRHFAGLGIALTEGNRYEINLAAVDWIECVARLLQRGFVLTIDYGYPADILYAPWRRTGTFLCYHRHTTNENPFERIGEQDMTSHVDFTLLERAGAEAGLERLYFGEQYRFLIALGFVDALIQAEQRENDPKRAQALRLTLKNLIVPEGGMGEIFKVLIQGKGVGNPQLLCGRAIHTLPFLSGSGIQR